MEKFVLSPKKNVMMGIVMMEMGVAASAKYKMGLPARSTLSVNQSASRSVGTANSILRKNAMMEMLLEETDVQSARSMMDLSVAKMELGNLLAKRISAEMEFTNRA